MAIKTWRLMCGALMVSALTSLGTAFTWPGLSRKAPTPQTLPKLRLVVLDFSMAPRIVERRDERRRLVRTEKPVETEKDVRGWWFGSNDVYYNANLGRIAADIFDEKMRMLPCVDVFSRQDLRAYYAQKRSRIAKKLDLNQKEAEAALEKLDPVAIGRELGVDKVVVGRLCDAELRKNRTFGPFASVVSFNVTVYDVKTGQPELSKSYRGHDNFSSVYSSIESRAKKFVREFEKSYCAK